MEQKKIIQDVHTVEQKPPLPQEAFPDSMAIVKKGYRRLWRPNNYRRQLNVKTKSDSTIAKIISAIPKTSIGKRNKLLFVPYRNILIQYGRDKLTGIYSQKIIDGEKEVFDIEGSSIRVIEEEITKRKEDIRNLIDDAIFSFTRKFNIVKPIEKPIWSRHEDWTTDLEIEEIPDWKILQGDHMKKVYPEGIEYIGGKAAEPTEQLINRVRNSGLMEFSPEIVKELELTRKFHEPLKYLKSVLKNHVDILNYPDLVSLLTLQEKFDLSEFIINKFGGV